MNSNIRENDNIEIKRVTIDGMNIRDILKDEFVAKLDEHLDNYTLYSLSIILDGEKPSKLISLVHALGGDYKADRLTVSAESEENLLEFLKLI
jgi:hypothetical protein